MPSVAKRIRSLIAAPEILVTPGVYDGFSARLVEQLGFKSAAITGAAAWALRPSLPTPIMWIFVSTMFVFV